MKAGPLVPLILLIAILMPGCIHTVGQGTPAGAPGLPAPSPLTIAPVPPEPPAPLTPEVPVGEIPAGTTPAPPLVRGTQPALMFDFNFTSGRTSYVITASLDPAALPSPGGGSNCPLASWRTGDEGVLASYYRSIFMDPQEDGLFAGLLTDLRRIRRMEGLNDDEYLELMVHFVQQIPYDPQAPVCPRTPAGVVLDGKGDCDEKSLILLGLLYREGYDSAILLFPEKQHATAGIRIQTEGHPSFRVYESGGRKYVYIETTRPSFIGLYPDDFETADPVIIPAGNGSISYRAINDVMHIVSTQKRMEEKMTWIATTCSGMLPEIENLEQKLSAGIGYSTQEEYDTDYSRYSTLVTQYNNYAEEFRQINEVYQYILDHQSDREGVSGRITNSKVENLL
jgi:hypothetical protein